MSFAGPCRLPPTLSAHGQSAWASWHSTGPAGGSTHQIGTYGIDLTGPHSYGVSVDASGNIQYWFDGRPVGAMITGGSNATEPMFLNLTMSIGGQANDGWASAPTAATPSTVAMHVGAVRVWRP